MDLFVRLALIATLAASVTPAASPPPNVVVVVVDDLGWMDLGCQGSDFYLTPNIDRLAATGMRFTDGYASCAVCSPTRAALLTGRSPARLGITDWIRAEFQLSDRQGPNVPEMLGFHRPGGRNRRLLAPVNEQQLPHEEITIAELLKPLGYASAFIGKWHLGGQGYLPVDQGFDENYGGWDYGQPPSYFDPYLKLPGLPMGIPTLEPRNEGEYLTDREADEAVAFIERNQDRPFLLYLSHYAVHGPLQAKQDLISDYEERRDWTGQDDPVYAAMVHSVDDAMGRVLETLERTGLADSTIVVFTSDNGGYDPGGGSGTDNAPVAWRQGQRLRRGLAHALDRAMAGRDATWLGVRPADRQHRPLADDRSCGRHDPTPGSGHRRRGPGTKSYGGVNCRSARCTGTTRTTGLGGEMALIRSSARAIGS